MAKNKSTKMKNWTAGDHRPVSLINIEKANKDFEEKKKKQMFRDFSIANIALEVSKIAVISSIKGTNFKNMKMAFKVDKILGLLEDIQKSELSRVTVLDPETSDMMQNEHCAQIYRWFDLMAFYPTEHIEAFNDGLQEQHRLGDMGIDPDPLFEKSDLEYFFQEGMAQAGISSGSDFETFYKAYLIKKKGENKNEL